MREGRALACVAAVIALACCTMMGIATATAPAATAAAAAVAAAVRVAGTAPVASGGTWGTAAMVPGSTVLNKGGFANVNSISCAAPGDCAAAGSYADSSHDNQAFVADEQAGRWRTAREVPGTGALNKFSANALSVSCSSAGDCAVGGFYEEAGQDSEAFVASELHGIWHPAAPVRGTVGVGAAVSSVSCAGVGDCVAGGYFTDRTGREQAFVAGQTRGTWGSAITVAASLNVAGNAYVTSVACKPAGNCAAGGYYSVRPGQTEAFTVNERHGLWSAAHEVAGLLNAGLFGSINSVSCASAGNCAAGGSYTDGAGRAQAVLVTEESGVWSAAQRVADALNAGGNAAANTVSCPSAGNCAAGGEYGAGNPFFDAFVVTERGGTWLAAREIAGNLNTNGARYSGIPAGTVAVKAGTATICVIHLKAGRGSCGLTAKKLRAGTYHLIATYGGGTGFLGSTTAAKTLTVQGAQAMLT